MLALTIGFSITMPSVLEARTRLGYPAIAAFAPEAPPRSRRCTLLITAHSDAGARA